MKMMYGYFRTKMGSVQFLSPPFQIHVKSEELKFKFNQFTFSRLSNNFVSIWIFSIIPYISEISISLPPSFCILETVFCRAHHFLKVCPLFFCPQKLLPVLIYCIQSVHAKGNSPKLDCGPNLTTPSALVVIFVILTVSTADGKSRMCLW